MLSSAGQKTLAEFIANAQFNEAFTWISLCNMDNRQQLLQGILYLWVNSLLEAGRFDAAGPLLEGMVKNDPADYYPHHELAILHTKKRDSVLAEREYREAVRLEPKGGPYTAMEQFTMDPSTTPSTMNSLYLQFGRVLFHNHMSSMGDFEEAVRNGRATLAEPVLAELTAVLDKAVELNPTDRRSLHQRAYVSFIARDYPTALVLAHKYMAFGDDSGETVKVRIMIEDCMRLLER